eukprot:5118789-Pyramimonas_sp.AAC.1
MSRLDGPDCTWHPLWTTFGPPLDPLWTPSPGTHLAHVAPPLDPLWTPSGPHLDPLAGHAPGARGTPSGPHLDPIWTPSPGTHLALAAQADGEPRLGKAHHLQGVPTP